jgi:NAD(P)-dependent dehydrogenase (short-subunit alcohol dehydrogenase family)
MRIGDSLKDKRVLITQSEEFMGPVLARAFADHGAIVITDPSPMVEPQAAQAVVDRAGRVDVLIANLAVPSPYTPATAVTDEEWRTVFSHLVDPLPRLARAVLPGMIERRAGKIVVMGSATALRGQKRVSTYAASRGAQLAWTRAVAAEVAPHNVQVNLIAQNFVENPTYYGPEVQALPAFQERLRREVPAMRLGRPEESALLAVFLAAAEVEFVSGEGISLSGGWV